FLNRIREDDKLVNVPVVVLSAKELTAQERAFLAERTLLVLSKGAQPIGSLGSALSAIAKQRVQHAPAAEQPTAVPGGPDAQNPAGRGQGDEPRYAFAPSRAQRIRGGGGRRRRPSRDYGCRRED